MNSLSKKISETVEAIDITTELFYQQNADSGYAYLQKTLELLISANELLNSNYFINKDNENEENKLNFSFMKAMEALEEKDVILLSDILKYEIKENFMSIINKN